ncbi:MAG: TadE/TadG family type IV pilus assembly protein [Planctomycetaceae bacterium]|jgi:hypothetical protein
MIHRLPTLPSRPSSRTSPGDRNGAALIETAGVLLTWIVLLVGTLDLGLVLLRHTVSQNLASKAARLAAVRGANSSPEVTPWGPATVVVTLDQAHPVANLLRSCTGGLSPDQFQVRLEWPDGDNGREHRVTVRVTTSQTTALTGLLPGNGTVPLQITTMARIIQ